MSLVLIYRGPLPAVKDNNKRKEEKQTIRRALHGQLRGVNKKPYARLVSDPDIFRPCTVGNFNFQALICHDSFYPRRGCGLEIKILSNDPYRAVYQSGDLDNRLKTLFDALCLPNEHQLPRDDRPLEGEDPFWVLLSDDKLITDLQITQDTLHVPMNSKNHVDLMITVKIKDEYQP